MFAAMAMVRMPSKPSIPVPRPVTFRVAGGAPSAGWVVQLSVVGVVVEAPAVIAMGAPVDLVLELRPGAPMACRARVQWSKPGCFGAQFTLLGARETHAIVEAMR
jgi:hypothetical protein